MRTIWEVGDRNCFGPCYPFKKMDSINLHQCQSQLCFWNEGGYVCLRYLQQKSMRYYDKLKLIPCGLFIEIQMTLKEMCVFYIILYN